jgi:prevent-host-death family protein
LYGRYETVSRLKPVVNENPIDDEVEHMQVSEARERFADLVNRAHYGGARIVIERRGRALAAIVPIEDLEAIRELEDKALARMANEALAESKGETIPYDKIRKDLGLE